MITLTMERLDHAVVLKLPTEHEHVMVALWRLGLNRDPHMYTLGELNAVFSYDTPEEHQMVRLIDMNNSLHFALCSLHEMLAPPVPYAQQLRKKLSSRSNRPMHPVPVWSCSTWKISIRFRMVPVGRLRMWMMQGHDDLFLLSGVRRGSGQGRQCHESR